MNQSFLFGTVGSPISTPKKPGGSVGAIQTMKSLGLGALELGWVQSVRVSEETCMTIRETAQTNQVAMSVHAPYYINLNASDEEWPNSRKRLMDAAKYGFLAGATDIIFHPGSYFNQEPNSVVDLVVRRLSECVEELVIANIDVILRPETMGKKAMLGSLEDAVAMSKRIPHVLPCLDFAHLHARAGDGSMNTEDEWVRVLEFYGTELGEPALQRLHIHMSGIEYSDKGERNHLKLDESDFDLQGLFNALKKFGCQGRILCESPAMEEDAILMRDRWAALQAS